MKRSALLLNLALGTTLFLTTQQAASAAVNTKTFATNRVVKVVKPMHIYQRGAKVVNKKLTLTNKVKKHATLKRNTVLNVRYMGNNVWQVVNNKYQSNKSGVWLLNANSTKWFKLVKQAKNLPQKWQTNHYVKTIKTVTLKQVKIVTKHKQTTLTNHVLQSFRLKKSTLGYVRNVGGGTWQFNNAKYQSDHNSAWIITQDNTHWFVGQKAPKNPVYQTINSRYQVAKTPMVNLNATTPTTVYAPYGFKPIDLGNNQTLNPGQNVGVIDDASNNRYVLVLNNQRYGFVKNNQYQFSTSNAQLVNGSNNIQSIYPPDNTNAVVPSTYQPSNGNLWIQVDNSGNPVQYYFYTSQNKAHVGWAKAKVVNNNGKSSIVPQD